MKSEQIEQQIDKEFDFLIRDYGFQRLSWVPYPKFQSYFEMSYKKEDVKIKVVSNREFIGVAVLFYFPKTYLRFGIELRSLISFVLQKPEMLVDKNPGEFQNISIEDDIVQNANLLKEYLERILTKFSPENISVTEEEHERFNQEVIMSVQNKYYRKSIFDRLKKWLG